MKRIHILRFDKLSIALLLICFVTTGCALAKLKKEVNESLGSTILAGRISTAPPGEGPIVVAAYSKTEQGIRMVPDYTVLHDAGEFEFMVAEGRYYVFAYRDKNRNLIYEAGEMAGQYGDPNVVVAPAGGYVWDIDFAISGEEGAIDLPYGSKISSVKPKRLHSRLAGTITDLDNPLFSEANGSQGFWEPFAFFKEIGGSIYLLEPYDPDKTPILFVHGAGGTPKGWRYFVNHIDRERFQPWFFYYPTGARIKSMSELLAWKLYSLQLKYKFKKLYITAHSMGGLVVRSFIMDYGPYFPSIEVFISLATPWGGDSMAEYGVKQSPAVIPSWIDMQPNGEFMKSLYNKEIPETISFYLFFGYKGGWNPFASNSDQTIALSSLLDPRSQSEAKGVYAFNEDHASIAYSEDVLARYNKIINTFNEKQGQSLQSNGGYIRIYFSYDYPVNDVRPRPSFVLRPVVEEGFQTIRYLNPDDSGSLLGPFPPGHYVASFFGEGVRPGKTEVPVFVETNETKTLRFVFRPEGMVAGYVTVPVRPEGRPAGMPSWGDLPPDKMRVIESVTLKGNGIHRVLHPIEGKDVDVLHYFISHTDFCHNGYFHFFGLPAGVYEVAITADGYKPVTLKRVATPGRQKDSRYTQLTPEK